MTVHVRILRRAPQRYKECSSEATTGVYKGMRLPITLRVQRTQ